jgi:hypothetical protein
MQDREARREARREAGNLEQADGTGARSDASEGVSGNGMGIVGTHRGGRCRQQLALRLRQLPSSIHSLRCVSLRGVRLRCPPLASIASSHAAVSARHGSF